MRNWLAILKVGTKHTVRIKNYQKRMLEVVYIF